MIGPFCEYSNVLGEPKKGFHEPRLNIGSYSFARNDIIGTIVIAIIITLMFGVSIYKSIFGAFAAGVLFHWLFCVDTESSKMINSLFQ